MTKKGEHKSWPEPDWVWEKVGERGVRGLVEEEGVVLAYYAWIIVVDDALKLGVEDYYVQRWLSDSRVRARLRLPDIASNVAKSRRVRARSVLREWDEYGKRLADAWEESREDFLTTRRCAGCARTHDDGLLCFRCAYYELDAPLLIKQ